MAKELICPVCGQVNHASHCSKCHYEMHVLPAKVSPQVEEYERRRAESYKADWRRREKSADTISDLTHRLETCQTDKLLVEGRLTEARQQMESLNVQVDSLSSLVSELTDDKSTLKTANEVLTERTEALQKELERLRSQQPTTQQPKPSPSAQQMHSGRAKAYLKVTSGQTEALCGVYEGENTYGCIYGNVDAPNHEEINVGGDTLEDRHFMICERNDRYVLFDYVGNIRMGTEPIPASGKKLVSGNVFTIGSDVTVKLFVMTKLSF